MSDKIRKSRIATVYNSFLLRLRSGQRLWLNISPGEGEIQFTITIPLWLVRILLKPVLLYRRFRYGYAFCRTSLTQGKFAIVDPDDFFRLSRRKWFAVKGGSTFYAVHSV
ncbi:MAG: hypothetical protein ACYS30_21430, partial [Planctomycetota bacterium]